MRTQRTPVRLAGGVVVLALAALAVPAAAEPLPTGAVNAVAGPQAAVVNYATPEVLSTAGTELQFVNLDQTTHDITSRATRTVTLKSKKKRQVPLFATPITAGGGVSVAKGTAGLKPGEYAFYCSLHPAMTGTLTVQ